LTLLLVDFQQFGQLINLHGWRYFLPFELRVIRLVDALQKRATSTAKVTGFRGSVILEERDPATRQQVLKRQGELEYFV
jgi:hypothetical protein